MHVFSIKVENRVESVDPDQIAPSLFSKNGLINPVHHLEYSILELQQSLSYMYTTLHPNTQVQIRQLYCAGKNVIIFFSSSLNMCLIETVLLSTHNICFG